MTIFKTPTAITIMRYAFNYLFLAFILVFISCKKKDKEEEIQLHKLYNGVFDYLSQPVALTIDANIAAAATYQNEVSLYVIDPSGFVLHKNRFDPGIYNIKTKAVVAMKDGDLFIAGYGYQSPDYEDRTLFIIKTRSNGEHLWTKNYGDSIIGHGMVETTDGNYVLMATKSDLLNTSIVGRAFLMKLDTAGNIIWFTRDTPLMYPRHFLQTTQGDFFVFGNNLSEDNKDVFIRIAKYNSEGDFLWFKDFDNFANSQAAIETSSGDILAAVNTRNRNENTFPTIMRIDQEGNQKWLKEYKDIPGAYFMSFGVNMDKTVTIAGFNNGVMLYKIDENGTSISKTYYHRTNIYPGFLLTNKMDEYFILGTVKESERIFMLRADRNGNFR